MKSEDKNWPNDLENKILKRLPWEILILAFLMALIIGLIFDFLSALLCLAGGVVSCLSFLWIKKSVSLYLTSRPGRRLGRLIGFQLLRLGLIALIFLTIIYFFSSRALAFIAGLAALLLAIAAEMIFSLRKRGWKV